MARATYDTNVYKGLNTPPQQAIQGLAAKLIADDITANCDAFAAQTITRAVWDAEQNRLWALAAARCLGSDVMRLVCPSLGTK